MTRVIVAVLDTNALASGFVRPNSLPGELLRRWEAHEFELVVSQHILDELARTLEKPYFAARLSEGQRAANLALLQTEALVVDLEVHVTGVAAHPEDDLVLATALNGSADYLVTGDKALLDLGAFQDIAVIGIREFLDVLDSRT